MLTHRKYLSKIFGFDINYKIDVGFEYLVQDSMSVNNVHKLKYNSKTIILHLKTLRQRQYKLSEC